MLAPIYGAVIKLLNRWTQTIADRLDAAVSTIAASSTALSTAIWTGTRAGKLDSLDATISSRVALSNYSTARAAKLDYLDAALTSVARIKNIQRGTITISGSAATATATVTSVTTSKAELYYMGENNPQTGSSYYGGINIVLTNATTVTATRTAPTSATQTIGWELVEYY